jgi:hypothetical protein
MAEKKAEPKKQSTESPKTVQAKGTEAKASGTSKSKPTGEKVAQKVKKAAERTGNGVAKVGTKVGKVAEELGKDIKETVDNDITPAAERAVRNVAETTKRIREEIGPAAEKARKGIADTSKKVREEIGPAAEKAGKGLSALFKTTARATRRSARILGIKASIAAETRKRQKLLADLGEKYFQTRKKKTPSQNDKDALDALIGEIKKVDAEIHTLEVKEKTTRDST